MQCQQLNYFSAVWMSYKTFYFTGGLKKHHASNYLQLATDASGVLRLRNGNSCPQGIHWQTAEWELRWEGRRLWLYIDQERTYELITLEKQDLVLLELSTGDKIFFTTADVWHRRVQPLEEEGDAFISIHLWSRTLAEVVRQEASVPCSEKIEKLKDTISRNEARALLRRTMKLDPST